MVQSRKCYKEVICSVLFREMACTGLLSGNMVVSREINVIGVII